MGFRRNSIKAHIDNTFINLDVLENKKAYIIICTFITNSVPLCSGSGQDEVNFHRGSSYVACFRFVAKPMLITHQRFGFCQTVPAQPQGFLFFWRFFFPLCAPPASRLGVGKNLGGDTARTTDSNRPKGYSIPYKIMLSNKKMGVGEEKGCRGRRNCLPRWPLLRLAGH